MTNETPHALTGYPATQDRADLPPVIAIDPGARWTGIAVRVGNECLAARTVHNCASVRPDGGSSQVIPVHRHQVIRAVHDPAAGGMTRVLVDEDVVEDILRAVWRLISDPSLDLAARQWWRSAGRPVADSESPWIIAVELACEPRETPAGQQERDGRRYVVTTREAVDYGALNAIASSLGTALDPVVWIAPRAADDRHSARGATGHAQDYWPGNLLTPGDPRVQGIPAGVPDRKRDPLNHTRAAYSVSVDAGLSWLREHGPHTPGEVFRPSAAVAIAALRGLGTVTRTPAQREADRVSRATAMPTPQPTTAVTASSQGGAL